MNRASDKMVLFFKCINVTCKFTETLEDMRKQELMQSHIKLRANPLDTGTHLPVSADSNQHCRASQLSYPTRST
jgi:hypothetical protein